MGEIKILDCTLRDGGYVNEWRFGEKTIENMIFNLTKSNVDIIECGFLSAKADDNDCSMYNSTEQLLRYIDAGEQASSMYVAMIAIGERELNPVLLSNANEGPLDGIRLTFHRQETEKAIEWAKIIMDKGYKLFMQPVGTTNYTDRQFLELLEQINKLHPYAFYIVDTLGIMYEKDLIRQVYLVDNNLDSGINLGYHSHNNFQLSFSNAQALSEYKTDREIIIDCSANGMGRGAGNLCSELMMDYLNKNFDKNYDVLPVLEMVDQYLMPIYLVSPWGYNSAYFLSAQNSCHPNYATYLMAKHTLSMPAIGNILQQLPTEKRRFYDKSLIESIYQSYQSNAYDDMKTINKLRKKLDGKNVLVIAPGQSVLKNRNKIEKYIENKKPIVIFVNFLPNKIHADYLFIGNSVRFAQFKDKLDYKKTIFTSNIKELPKKAIKVNYSELVNAADDASDSSGIMVLQLLKKVSVHSVALAGYDGFTGNTLNNYIDRNMCGLFDTVQLKEKNYAIKKHLLKLSEKMKIKFITPSVFNKDKQKKGAKRKVYEAKK